MAFHVWKMTPARLVLQAQQLGRRPASIAGQALRPAKASAKHSRCNRVVRPKRTPRHHTVCNMFLEASACMACSIDDIMQQVTWDMNL